MPAAVLPGSAASAVITSTVLSMTPPTAPRQPAWIAAIAQQDRRAVGRENAEDQAGGAGDHGVGFGALAERERLVGGDGARRVDLPRGREAVGRGAEGEADALAVLGDFLRLVA